MIDKRRIIIMSKLALYEKKYGKKDSKTNQYHRNDYVYIKNLWTRLSVGFCTIIIIGIYWLHKIMIDGVDIQTIDYRQALIQAGIALIAVVMSYTLIGTLRETVVFNKSSKRLNKYTSLLNQLEQANKRAENETREAALLNGTNSVYPRSYDQDL